MSDTTEQRQQVETAYGEHITDEQWESLKRLLGDDPHESFAEDWADTLRGLTSAGFAVPSEMGVEIPGPAAASRWDESKRVLEGHSNDQVKALAIVGLDDFVPGERIWPLLHEIACLDGPGPQGIRTPTERLRCYSSVGDRPEWSRPDYEFEPFSYPDRMFSVEFSTGISVLESAQQLLEVLPTRPPEMDDETWRRTATEGSQRREAWLAMRLSRLSRLKRLVDGLVASTDCLEADALAFLLSNTPFLLPRVRVFRERSPFKAYDASALGFGPYQPQLTIRIASSEIPAGEVLAAYQAARKALLLQFPPMGRTERDSLLVAFRDETLGSTWRVRREKWNSIPGRPRFETPDRMKAIYHQAKKRLEEDSDGTPQ